MNNPYVLLQMQPPESGVLTHALDRYSGVTVPETSLEGVDDPADFARLLTSSLARWSELKRRGLWLQIPVEKGAFISVAAKEGFVCHHAQPRYVMMTLWLPERTAQDAAAAAAVAGAAKPTAAEPQVVAAGVSAAPSTVAAASASAVAAATAAPPAHAHAGGGAVLLAEPSMIPAYASHSLGVGCAVLNSRGQLLVIQEHFSHPSMPCFWKLPGGAVDAGEELPAAAEREVLEETSVHAKFRSIVGFRHVLNFRFGTGDLYFIVVCAAEESDGVVAEPVPQEGEISAAKWMDLQEFLHFHSSRWMQDLVREPLLQEWSKMYPDKSLPPPPSPERIAELASYPAHPQAAEGKSYPIMVPPQPPTPGSSVAMRYARFKGLLGMVESNFYVVSPPNLAHLRGEAGQAAAAAAAAGNAASAKPAEKQ